MRSTCMSCHRLHLQSQENRWACKLVMLPDQPRKALVPGHYWPSGHHALLALVWIGVRKGWMVWLDIKLHTHNTDTHAHKSMCTSGNRVLTPFPRSSSRTHDPKPRL